MKLFDTILNKQPIYKMAPKKGYDFSVYLSMCIHRTLQVGCIDSMIKSMFSVNPKISVSHAMGDALIDRARSREASAFLNSDHDVCLMVDDDIQFSPEDAIRICRSAYERKGIVCGTYVIKREEFQWITAKPLPDSPPIIFSSDSPEVEVMWPGTGFLAFHKNVLIDLLAESPKYQFHDPNHFPLLHPTDLRYYNFFKSMEWVHPNGDVLGLSEDWAFGEKCRRIGYQIWLDPKVRLTHWGLYGYTLDDLCRPERMHCEKIKYEDYKDKTLVPRDEGKQVELAQI